MTKVMIKNQSLILLPQRAVFWEEQSALILSDIHLGKASTMQRAGIAVPEGAMDADLKRLQELVKETQAKRCLIVGDLIHAHFGLSEHVVKKFKDTITALNCPVELILGNHDRSLIKQLPEDWHLHLHLERLCIGPFCFTHLPKEVEGYYVWSGHIHPQVLIKDRHDQVTLRCFHLMENLAILPAFSDFVGGAYIKREAQSEIYAIIDDANPCVIKL